MKSLTSLVEKNGISFACFHSFYSLVAPDSMGALGEASKRLETFRLLRAAHLEVESVVPTGAAQRG
jgi:hypothetical protein